MFHRIYSHCAQKDFKLISENPSACTLVDVIVTSVQYFHEEFKTQVISTSIVLVLEVGDILLSLYDFHKLRLTVNAANSNQGFTMWESSDSA
jgi:hypothetical protein